MGAERGTKATVGPASVSAPIPDVTLPVPDAAVKIDSA